MNNSMTIGKIILSDSGIDEHDSITKAAEKIKKLRICEQVLEEIKFYVVTSLCKREELIIEITDTLFSILVSYFNEKIIVHRVSENQAKPTLFGVEVRILYEEGCMWGVYKKIAAKEY